MDFEKFEKKEYFVNRELSWLKFDERVLSEARDKNLPLFDRLKFLSITASNLDEFFMVRVASLKDQVHAGYHKTDIAGMTAKEQLKEISVRTHELVHVQYNTLNRSLIPALEKAGMHLVAAHENLTEAQSVFVDRYFEDNVYPVLTPMAMDSSRPFPLIRNKTLNIGALISKKEKSDKLNKKDKTGELLFATVQVPSVLPRVVQIPSKKDGDTTVILLEEIIERNIDKLFLSYDVICAHPYRIMRNADLTIDEDEAEDLLVELADKLSKGSRDALSEKTEWVLHSISCRAAIKAGDHTSPQELMALAEKILSGEVPPFCPHGRPCVLKLTRKELEKQFGRIV